MIIYKANRFTRIQVQRNLSEQPESNSRKSEMSRTILTITFLFVGFNMPGAIVNGFFYNQVVAFDFGPVIINILAIITFSFPALNFFILIYSNKLFVKEIKILILRRERLNFSKTMGSTNPQPIHQSTYQGSLVGKP
jgi:hypothetical protein